MREGSFYKFWVYIIVSRTSVVCWRDWVPGSMNPSSGAVKSGLGEKVSGELPEAAW